MSGKRWLAIRCAVGAVLFAAVAAQHAMAASNIGKNLGDEVQAIGSGVLLAVAGVAGLSAFGQRDFGRLAQVFVVSVGCGGFLFAGPSVQRIIVDLWTNVTQ